MPSAAADMPVVEVDDRFHNLIPSRFPPVRPYERIADGRDDHFAAIKCLTNPRLREKVRLAGKPTPVDPESVRFENWNHAPFAYPNPEGSSFYGPAQDRVELEDALPTAFAIAVALREQCFSPTEKPAKARAQPPQM